MMNCPRLIVAAALVAATMPAHAQNTLLDGRSAPKYVHALPIPGVQQPISPGGNAYEVTMTEFQQFLGVYSNGQPRMTTVWGYNGASPGASFDVRSGTPIDVRYINSLPTTHLLPIDTTVHGAEPSQPAVRTVAHLHGGHVDPDSDGGPEDWFVPGQFVDFHYRNDQQAATLWIHDHALGITRLNVVAGLAMFYIIRDSFEDSLNLPSGAFEIPLVIQDRMFYDDGSLAYPDDPIPGTNIPSIVPEFFGDFILVNGMAWPYLEVEPRKYRFRILNGSNARFYRMFIGGGPTFWQIGTDGGLLAESVPVPQLLLAPGERADVIVDFSMHAGQTLTLRNLAKIPFPNGETPDPRSTGQLMQFRVAEQVTEPDTSALPGAIRPIVPLSTTLPPRMLDMVEGEDEFGRLHLLLNGMDYMEPVTETPELNTTEIWTLINPTEDTHPIHLHLVQFQILDRQRFNTRRYNQGDPSTLRLLGRPKLPDANEAGWKDTVRVNPGEVVRIIAHFDIPGMYVWHCHLLEHEDHSMMRPFEVIVPPSPFTALGPSQLEAMMKFKARFAIGDARADLNRDGVIDVHDVNAFLLRRGGH
jgi:spore coat protein A, manganese oxidase